MRHVPILCEEVVENLIKKAEGIYMDCTVGFGGHSEKILKKLNNKGKLLGIEIDPYALEKSNEKLSQHYKNFSLYNCSYINFPQILIENNVDPFKMDEAERLPHYLAGWNRMFGHITPLEIAKREGIDDIAELLSDYIRVIMIQRNRRRKLKNRRIRTLRSMQRLSLSRGMEDRDSVFGSIRYDPSLLESISSHLSRIRPTNI